MLDKEIYFQQLANFENDWLCGDINTALQQPMKQRVRVAVFTAQTNLVVWMMTSVQLRGLWKFNNTFIWWVPDSLIDLKHFNEMKSIGKMKMIKS